MIQLNSQIIEGFMRAYLWNSFDDASEFGDFHREMWDYCTRKDKYVAIAAPRAHSKSTSVTLGYTLASVLFKNRRYVLLVSDTEAQASMFLMQIKQQIAENEDLQQAFRLRKNAKGEVHFIKETETDIICEFVTGEKFRIMAKGSEQKLRGLLWNGMRPDLILCDDIENDELVMNKERRDKFRRWITGALLPCLSSAGIVRWVGTILHMDSMLERLMPRETGKNVIVEDLKIYTPDKKSSAGWLSVKYRAHSQDFSKILWPDRWNKASLIEKRDLYIAQGLGDVYSQEYLNVPLDDSRAHFKRADFLQRRVEDREKHLNYYITGDLAISEKDKADYTVFVVGGVDENNTLHIIQVIRDRMDGQQIVETMLQLQRRFKPMAFGLEDMQVSKAIGPFLREEMQKQDTFINLIPLSPHKSDKLTRTYSIQARMRAGAVRFDKESEWYQPLEDEMCRFPRDRHDDQVDCMAYLGLMLDSFVEGATSDELKKQEYEEEQEEYENIHSGRSRIGGY
jgi:predicted phage terminase large subunit-like protein